MTLWFLLLFAGVAGLMMALAVPLMYGRVKPNSLYGLRTERTLRDEDAWYRGNAYGGRLFFRTGMVALVAVVGLYCVPSLRDDFVAYNIVCGAVIVGGVIFSTVMALRFVDSL
jgi:uncharacterized membrane protein